MQHQKVQITIFETESNSVLLLQTNKKRLSFWQNVTGSVEINEVIEDAARRELQEETSFKDFKLQQLDLKFRFTDRWNKDVTEYCFLALITDKLVPKLSAEHQTSQWIKLSDISTHHFKYSNNFECFQKAYEQYLREKQSA